MSGPQLVRFAPLVVLVAVLAGCAPAAPGPTPSPVAGESAIPTASPTPTPSAASAPGSRIPVGCSGLFGAPLVRAVTGSTGKVFDDETTPPTDMTSIALQQYGGLFCDWDPTAASAASPGAELQVYVAPDAKAAFEAQFPALMSSPSASGHPAATENVAGDQSGYWCRTDVDGMGADFTLEICDGEMLVGNYWVGIEIDTVDGLSRAQLVKAIAALMTDDAAKLQAAGAPPAQWVPPSSTPPSFCTAPSSTALVRGIVGDRELTTFVVAHAPEYVSSIGLVGPSLTCGWKSAAYGELYVELLAGGAWAFPAITPVATGDADYAGAPYKALTVAGATSTKIACGDGDCDAYLAVGTSAVEIIFDDRGTTRNTAILAAFAKAIAAS